MELLKRLTLGILFVTVVLLAVVMGTLRLVIHNIEYFKPEIEYLLERDLAPGFVFTGLGGDVNGFNPVVSIENVSVTLPDRSQPLFIDHLEIELDFWASWREQAPVVLQISGKLEKLELVKDRDGIWSVNDVPLSIDREQGPAPEFRQVLALVPRYLNLSLNRLIVHDRKAGDTHQLDRIEARIDHKREQFFIELSAALPERLGQGFLMKSIVGPKHSLVYLNSSNLRLAPVARLFDLDTWGVEQGALDGELWINMAAYEVLGVNGDLVLKNGMVRAAPEKPPLKVSYKSRFSALKQKSSWRIANQFERLSIDTHRVPPFRTQLEMARQGERRVLSAWVDQLRIPSLPVVAGQWLPARFSEQLQAGEFRGRLRDIWFSIDLDRPQDFYFSGRAQGIGNRAFGDYPGARNLNADIVAGNGRLGAALYGKRVSLDFGSHFNAPIRLDNLRLEVRGQRDARGLLLALDDLKLGNDDVSAVGRAWLQFDGQAQPFTYIRVSFKDADGRSTSKYIPRNYLPLQAQAWLDRGIKDGFVPAGEMQFHGRLRDIRDLNRERAGEFFVDFEIERGDVFFSPGWLQAKNGQGRVLFHNVSMDILLDRVSYDRLEHARAWARIADFGTPLLELRIETDTSARLAVDTWLDTPVGKQYRQVMSNLEDLGGEIGSSVALSLSLQDDDAEADVEVQVSFDGVSARSEAWGLELSRINGEMRVTPQGFYARGIGARFFDDPVRVDIDTPKPGGNIQVRVSGRIEARSLLNKFPPSLTRDLHGKSDWRLRLSFAGADAAPDKPFLRLNASSKLRDTRSDIPQPFTKLSSDSLETSVDIDFFPEQIWFGARLGADIRGRGRLVPDAERNFELDMLDIAFATDLRRKPRRGMHLYGSIDEVSVDDWVRFVKTTGEAKPELLQSAELSFERAFAFDRELEKLRVEVGQQNKRYQGSVESTSLSGRFSLPWRPTTADPMLIDLDHLRIDRVDEESGEANPQPSDLVDFHLKSKAVVFHDMSFNDLHVEARRVGDNLVVDKLGIRKNDLVLQGTAQWDYNAVEDSHLSSISMTVRGDNLGEALAGLGFGDSMSDGSLIFIGGFTWPAPLFAFSVDNLVGDARFRVEEGVLNNVEPGGGGRFVGLFSLSALPRRLALDFSDVLIKGMEFDEIVGTYRIEQGILRTEDTRMEGTSAVIRISGETDIARESYDQSIVVTPKLSQTLPLLGAVSAGSTVGWGLLLLQSLFKKAIDGAVEVEYHVTGTWDDPKIELVKAVDENQQELPTISDEDRR